MFGGIFDFDMDGKIDEVELALGLSIVFGSENKEKEVEDECDFDFDFFDEEAEDDFSTEISISNLEWERETLSCRLSELQDRLFDLEDQEPDDYACAAYDSWERRKNRLGEQIFDLEDQIAEMESRISFGMMGMYSQAV